ncbi:hypothetical protein C671_2806 [[Clostridium] bifermentans ATCC 19299]|nr:hypothetical protein C671_2806 [[Clostridium] bifermentans ATCC 19299] [Paraclostridium bifermentans ATCC 19299]
MCVCETDRRIFMSNEMYNACSLLIQAVTLVTAIIAIAN